MLKTKLFLLVALSSLLLPACDNSTPGSVIAQNELSHKEAMTLIREHERLPQPMPRDGRKLTVNADSPLFKEAQRLISSGAVSFSRDEKKDPQDTNYETGEYWITESGKELVDYFFYNAPIQMAWFNPITHTVDVTRIIEILYDAGGTARAEYEVGLVPTDYLSILTDLDGAMMATFTTDPAFARTERKSIEFKKWGDVWRINGQ